MKTPHINRIATTGPFGLWQGMDGSQVGADLEQLRPFWFRPAGVPQPHPGICGYCLAIAPRAGLSLIETLGYSIKTDACGTELRSAFKAMEAELTATYGDHGLTDGRRDGRPACTAPAWLQAMRSGEQQLSAQWSAEEGSPLVHGLASVTLEAQVGRSPAYPGGHLAMKFVFLNHAAATAEIASWRIVEDEDDDEDC